MQRRGILFSIIISLLVFPSLAYAAFPDVAQDSPTFAATEYLKAKNVISGYPDGTFQPDKTINRAEALKMVIKAAGLGSESIEEIGFSDVSTSDWFYPFVQKGVEKGIIEGYDDNTFRPGNNINVAESLKIIILSFGIDPGSQPLKNPYVDVDPTAWYSKYANYAREKQIIWTQDDGKLHAERDITRGEFAQIIYRLMYVKENNLDKFPLNKDWPVYVDHTNGFSISYPFSWQKIQANDEIIFWKKDEINNQLSWARVYPNSAVVVMALDKNQDRLSLDQYLAGIKYEDGASVSSMTLNGYPFTSINLVSKGILDYYFEFPNKSILAVYCQVGDGDNQTTLLEQMRYMIGSIKDAEVKNTAGVSDRDVFLSDVRKQILVSGASQQVLGLFSDLVLIDTDSIGIGTGPVDYYYSEQMDVTLKIERNSNTLLAINDSKGTAF